MATPKPNKMTLWLITRPAIFSIFTFLFMMLAAFVAGFISPHGAPAGPLHFTFVTLALIISIAIMIRMMPGANLDRRSFVAVNTAQTFLVSMVFCISTIFVIANAQTLALRLLWLEANSSTSFIILLIGLALFYLYIFGIVITNLYAKYRRVRAMGVPMWKTLASAPFGFSLLWIPGWLVPDTNNKNTVIQIKTKWYTRLTDWITARATRAAGILVLLILFSGFFFGFNAALITMAMAVLFAAWAGISGIEKFKEKIGGAYANVAIIVNVVFIAAFLAYGAITNHRTENTSIQIQQNMPETTTENMN